MKIYENTQNKDKFLYFVFYSVIDVELTPCANLILWVKFSIQNVVLRVSNEYVFLTECLSKCPSFTKPPLT